MSTTYKTPNVRFVSYWSRLEALFEEYWKVVEGVRGIARFILLCCEIL